MPKTTQHILTLPQPSIQQPNLCGSPSGTTQWDSSLLPELFQEMQSQSH